MRQIRGTEAAKAILVDPSFVVPAVPPGSAGIGWLRATVGRFATGAAHRRRRALAAGIIAAIGRPKPAAGDHPVTTLARAMGIAEPVLDLIRDTAQAYQPGTGHEARADTAVERLVTILGGAHDEPTAARIGVLVQACDATPALEERLRDRPLDQVLHEDPPVRFTKRQATVATRIGDLDVGPGELVLVELGDDLAFGHGPRSCPGAALAVHLASRGGES